MLSNFYGASIHFFVALYYRHDMASFFRQLGHKVAAWGRPLAHNFTNFGRQVSHVAGDVSHGLGNAHKFLSSIEKVTNKIPVAGQIVHALDSGVITAQHGANAVGALGRGHVGAAFNQGKQAFNSGKGAIGDIAKAGVAAAPFLV